MRFRRGPKEIEVRVRHHANKLRDFTKIMKQILVPRPKVLFLASRVRFKNKNGTFILKGYKDGGSYIGVEIKKFRGPSVRLQVVD